MQQFANSEVTLIGTGGGYGESVVIHLKDRHWIVVDSCIDPNTQQSLPLQYLISRGVDVENEVKLIICTHWRDDHIRGLYKLFQACKNANFCFAPCHDTKKFLFLVGLDSAKSIRGSSNSSTYEFSNCVSLAKERGISIKRAIQDKMLYKHSDCEVYALSPSDYTLQKFDKEVSTLITEYGAPDKKIVISSPNAKSIALYLKFGDHRALLGSDLEVSTDSREGWRNIIDNCTKTVIDRKASLYKVPHHGSETAYHVDIWNSLLTQQPISNLTPWNRGERLPQLDMLEKMVKHSNNIHITSSISGNKAKRRDKNIEKFIQKINPSLKEIKYNFGIIKSTINPSNEKDIWNVELIGSAKHINSLIREYKNSVDN